MIVSHIVSSIRGNVTSRCTRVLIKSPSRGKIPETFLDEYVLNQKGADSYWNRLTWSFIPTVCFDLQRDEKVSELQAWVISLQRR
jgi:hypothetical protein